MENLENNENMGKISAEILEHMMNPRNYGKMVEPDGVGMGVDKKTGEFAMVYVKGDSTTLEDITFGCNACQDTVVAGSLFTEMVKGDSFENAQKAASLMDEKLEVAPKRQQACSRMVIKAFEAAMINREDKLNGKNEDMFTIDMKESCEGVNQDGVK